MRVTCAYKTCKGPGTPLEVSSISRDGGSDTNNSPLNAPETLAIRRFPLPSTYLQKLAVYRFLRTSKRLYLIIMDCIIGRVLIPETLHKMVSLELSPQTIP